MHFFNAFILSVLFTEILAYTVKNKYSKKKKTILRTETKY